MDRTEKRQLLRQTYRIGAAFLLISFVIFAVFLSWVQFRDLRDTFSQAQETVSFLEAECEKFDNYNRGNSARSLQSLLDTAIGLRNFIPPSKFKDADFLKQYIHAQHVSGVLILDASASVVSQADMDDKDAYAIWSSTLNKTGIKDVWTYPRKTYVGQTTVSDIPYDFAVVSSTDGAYVFVCYSSRLKPNSDPYEYTIDHVLENNSFYKNPVAAIADKNQVLSTNHADWEKMGKEAYKRLDASIKWKDNGLICVTYDNKKWYGLYRVYGDYRIYVMYPSSEVFANRTNLIAGGLMVYLLCCMLLVLVRWFFDKASLYKMQKQLRIIDSISTTYDSTFLLHMDRREIEPLKPSARLDILFKQHPNVSDFLYAVCVNEISPVYRLIMKRFLQPDTIGERMKGQPYLEIEVKDVYEAWYSVLVIPQQYDAQGNLTEVIITTKNVTTIKQAEELSFKDKLTGLYNRNYLEYRNKEIVSADNYPVSVIMADCNYLKRTNDTLGHEYGDLLLQRVAISIKSALPKNGTAIRVGGDEFVILCTRCEEKQARQLVEKIRQKLKDNSDEVLQVSVSFGVYTIEDDTVSFEQAYQLADQEMYKDKVASKANRE